MFYSETCPPFNLSNGDVNYTRQARDRRYSPGTEIKVECYEGFSRYTEYAPTILDVRNRKCDAQGNWIGPFIGCIGETIRLLYFRRFVLYCQVSKPKKN